MRCGPAEYHVEIIINMLEKHTRLSLSDLMRIERIRNWILQNRPKTADRSILETEIDYAFYLVVEGLKGVADFEWIYSGDSMAES